MTLLRRLTAFLDRHNMLRCQEWYYLPGENYRLGRQCEKPRNHSGRHGAWDGSTLSSPKKGYAEKEDR